VIAIDGKTSRRSCQKKGGKAPIHMVSAFAARQRLALSLPPDLIRGARSRSRTSPTRSLPSPSYWTGRRSRGRS
jgi:hypothetical protein